MTHAQIKKVTSKMADENFAKDTFQSFVRKTVLTDFFFTKSGLISLERQFASALWKRMEYKFLHWIFYWNKIYQSNPILIHLTSLTSICFGQGVWEEGWMTVPRRWQGSAWGSWPTSPRRTSKEGGEQGVESDETIPQSRLLSVEAWGATSTLRRLWR